MRYIGFIMLIICVAGCAVNPMTGKRELMIFSDAQEIEFGQSADPNIRWQFGGLYNDDSISSYVNSVGQKVAAVCDRSNIPYHFAVVDTSVINAFALPGGYVYITRGLLAKLDNEAELASVLGHEIGHINARHSMKRLQSNIGFNVLISIVDQVASGSEGYQKRSGLIKGASSIAFATVSLGYGRKDELEADALGTKYAAKGGYSPEGMVQLLELLKSLSEREPSSVEEFFMSHPKTSIRITEVNKQIAQMPADQKNNALNQSGYKAKVADLVQAQKAYDHYDKGEELRRNGKYNEALSEYNQALKIRSNIAPPHYGIGLIYQAQGKHSAAISEYKKAVAIDSDYIFAYNRMGEAYIAMKQYDEAETALKKAITVYPSFDDAFANLGEAYYGLKRYSDGLKSLEMAITLNNTHQRAYTTLGLIFEAMGDSQKAIEAYEAAIKVAPESSYTNTARQRLSAIKKSN